MGFGMDHGSVRGGGEVERFRRKQLRRKKEKGAGATIVPQSLPLRSL